MLKYLCTRLHILRTAVGREATWPTWRAVQWRLADGGYGFIYFSIYFCMSLKFSITKNYKDVKKGACSELLMSAWQSGGRAVDREVSVDWPGGWRLLSPGDGWSDRHPGTEFSYHGTKMAVEPGTRCRCKPRWDALGSEEAVAPSWDPALNAHDFPASCRISLPFQPPTLSDAKPNSFSNDKGEECHDQSLGFALKNMAPIISEF